MNIVQYLQAKSPSAANRWHIQCLEKIVDLRINPRMWPRAPEQHKVSFELRHCLLRTKSRLANRILFMVEENDVTVLAIRRPGQTLVEPDDLNF